MIIDEYAEVIAYSYVQGYLNSLLDKASEALDQLEATQLDGSSIKELKERIKDVKMIMTIKMKDMREGYMATRTAEKHINMIDNNLLNQKKGFW
jgi:hypothetical protein